MPYQPKTSFSGANAPVGYTLQSPSPVGERPADIGALLTAEDKVGLFENAALAFNGVFAGLLQRVARGEPFDYSEIINYIKEDLNPAHTSILSDASDPTHTSRLQYFASILGVTSSAHRHAFDRLFADETLFLDSVIKTYLDKNEGRVSYAAAQVYVDRKLRDSPAHKLSRVPSAQLKAHFLDKLGVSDPETRLHRGHDRPKGLIIRKSLTAKGDELY